MPSCWPSFRYFLKESTAALRPTGVHRIYSSFCLCAENTSERKQGVHLTSSLWGLLLTGEKLVLKCWTTTLNWTHSLVLFEGSPSPPSVYFRGLRICSASSRLNLYSQIWLGVRLWHLTARIIAIMLLEITPSPLPPHTHNTTTTTSTM